MLTAAPTPCAEAVGELGEDPPSEQEPWRPWTTYGEEAVSSSNSLRHPQYPALGTGWVNMGYMTVEHEGMSQLPHSPISPPRQLLITQLWQVGVRGQGLGTVDSGLPLVDRLRVNRFF